MKKINNVELRKINTDNTGLNINIKVEIKLQLSAGSDGFYGTSSFKPFPFFTLDSNVKIKGGNGGRLKQGRKKTTRNEICLLPHFLGENVVVFFQILHVFTNSYSRGALNEVMVSNFCWANVFVGYIDLKNINPWVKGSAYSLLSAL